MSARRVRAEADGPPPASSRPWAAGVWAADLLRPSREALAGLSLGGSSLRLSAANLVFVLLSTLQVLVAGAVFGTSRRYELFLLAWLVPEWCLFGLGNVLQMHLTPALMEVAAGSGRGELRTAASRLFLAALVFLGAVAGLGWMLAPWLVPVVAPGLGPSDLGETVRLFRWLLPTAAALGMVKLLGTLHRVNHSLVLVSLSQSVTPVLVAGLLLAAPRLGAWAFVLGFTGGALAQLALLLPAPIAWGDLRPDRRLYHPVMNELARATLPLLFATTGFRLVVFLDRVIASSLAPGDVAVLRYAFLFLVAAQGVLVLPVLSVGYNRLAQLAAVGARDQGRVVLLLLEVLWLLVIPLTLAEVIFAEPLVQVLLERRAFGPEAVMRTAGVLAAYAPTLPFAVGFSVALQAFLSRRRVGFVAALAVAFPLAGVPLKVALGHAWGIYGVALGTPLVMAAWFLVLLVPLLAAADQAARRRLLRILLALLAAVVSVLVTLGAAEPFLPPAPLLRIVVGSAALAATYALVLWALARRAIVLVWRDLAGTRMGT